MSADVRGEPHREVLASPLLAGAAIGLAQANGLEAGASPLIVRSAAQTLEAGVDTEARTLISTLTDLEQIAEDM
jgi:hypothetical protein